ncbi:MAG: OmpA family protein [Propionibacteriaceae bacterium]|nr:OmpA family protein [Propionibacteriaceae bacterium]
MPKVVIYFEGGTDKMTPGQTEKVGAMAAWLKANPRVEVEVAGHTDNGRTAAFRAELGAARARRVVDALVAAGVARDRMSVVAKGEKDPAASNDSAAGRAENRRVTFASRGER